NRQCSQQIVISTKPSLGTGLAGVFVHFLEDVVNHPGLHSFPTRRSSDLDATVPDRTDRRQRDGVRREHQPAHRAGATGCSCDGGDRKSTRLNSSHVKISYAVFCLKKKEVQTSAMTTRHNAHTCTHSRFFT